MAKKTIKISCDEMIERVTKEFIVGSDAAFLKKVAKAAKGGGLFNDVGRAMWNKDKTIALGVLQPFFFFMKSKEVVLNYKTEGVYYTMDPKKDWPKSYEAVLSAVERESRK